MHEKIEKDSDIGSIFFKNFLYSFSSALFLLKLESENLFCKANDSEIKPKSLSKLMQLETWLNRKIDYSLPDYTLAAILEQFIIYHLKVHYYMILLMLVKFLY